MTIMSRNDAPLVKCVACGIETDQATTHQTNVDQVISLMRRRNSSHVLDIHGPFCNKCNSLYHAGKLDRMITGKWMENGR